MRFTSASLLLAAIAVAACDSKTATIGEAAASSATVEAVTTDPAVSGTSGTRATSTDEANAAPAPAPSTIPVSKSGDAHAILARPQVPILCYHQIRDWTARDAKNAKDYITPIATFNGHIKMLADSGYHTVSPDQL